MIGVIDYGCGNMGSIVNMLLRTGHEAVVIDRPEQAEDVTQLVLPGVGAFDAGMRHLAERGWVDALDRQVRQDGKPLLGICLGMQLLLESSEEGTQPGLGWIPGRVIRFSNRNADGSPRRVPHMGWNTVAPAANSHLLADWFDSDERPRYYFVHSYHAADVEPSAVAGTTRYGDEAFTSAIESRGNGMTVMATQFHPEKSHRFGIALLNRFAELKPETV